MISTPRRGWTDANEFYTVASAERLRDVLPTFNRGKGADRRLRRALQMPAGAQRMRLYAARLSGHSRCARCLRDQLRAAADRARCRLRRKRRERWWRPSSSAISASSQAAASPRSTTPGRSPFYDDGVEMPFDLFLGVPKHRVPDVVMDSGMAENGWIPVNPHSASGSESLSIADPAYRPGESPDPIGSMVEQLEFVWQIYAARTPPAFA